MDAVGVAEAIACRIAEGEWRTGEKLPTQGALATEYGATRHIMRAALDLLEQRGCIAGRQGSGSYVRGALIDYHIRSRTRYGENTRGAGNVTRMEFLDLQTRRGSAEVTRALALPRGARVYDLHVLRWTGTDPLCIAHHRLPVDIFPDLPEKLSEATGIGDLIGRLGVADFRRSDTAITARAPTRDEAAMLRISTDSPVVVIEGRNVDLKGQPVEISTSVWPAARIRVHV